jgi:hypothetical protein
VEYTAKNLIVHIDNALAKNSRMTQNFFRSSLLKRLSHPPYFPDISPLDFYLFGKVKSSLVGREISNEIDPFETVTEMLNGIFDAELQRVFRSWIERVERAIDAGGGDLIL